MAEIVIKLIYNLETGKKDLVIEYESDPDALPREHEKRHREIVEQLIGRGVVSAEEVGDIRIERLRPGQPEAEPSPTAGREPERAANRSE
jgi:hypothetical protein